MIGMSVSHENPAERTIAERVCMASMWSVAPTPASMSAGTSPSISQVLLPRPVSGLGLAA